MYFENTERPDALIPIKHTAMKYINKEDITRKHDLTIAEVKSFPMFADFTDEQAAEVVVTIKKFVEIVLECYRKEQEKQGNSVDF